VNVIQHRCGHSLLLAGTSSTVCGCGPKPWCCACKYCASFASSNSAPSSETRHALATAILLPLLMSCTTPHHYHHAVSCCICCCRVRPAGGGSYREPCHHSQALSWCRSKSSSVTVSRIPADNSAGPQSKLQQIGASGLSVRRFGQDGLQKTQTVSAQEGTSA
jgi:hypothetical protein